LGDLGKIWAKFEQRLSTFGPKWWKLEKIRLDLGKIETLHPPKHSISYSYVSTSFYSYAEQK